MTPLLPPRLHLLRLGAILALGAACAAGCGARGRSADDCRPQSWEGQCRLDVARKVRTLERFPRSFVVYEAIYYPVESPGAQGFTPPGVRKEVVAPALHEGELQAHLNRHSIVACRTEAAPPGSCEAPPLELALPDFQPSDTAHAETPRARGCALLDSGEAPQGPPPGAVSFPEQILFPERSAAPTEAAADHADAIARALQGDPRIECVAVTGQTAPGEPSELAAERARAVVELLATRGVDRSRLVVFGGARPVYAGAGPAERTAQPEQRRAKLSVVLYRR